MAFDSLSERLNKAMRDVAGKGTLSDANMEDMLKEVRLALLEADVNYRIVKQFLDEIREKARGSEEAYPASSEPLFNISVISVQTFSRRSF